MKHFYIFILLILYIFTIHSKDNDNVRELSGGWEFYWNKLLTPADFENNPELKPDALIDNPKRWTRIIINGKKLSGTGQATYRLKLKHNLAGAEAGIKLRKINFAYKLYADSKLIAETGKISESPESFKPSRFTGAVYFTPEADETVLTLLVSNHFSGDGGVIDHIYFGSKKSIEKETGVMFALDSALLSSRIIIFLIFLGFYIIFKNYPSLFYSIYNLVLIIRISGVREMLFFKMFPDFNLEIFSRLFIISAYISAFFILLTVYTLFKSPPFFPNRSFTDFLKKGVDEKFVFSAAFINLFIIIFFSLTPKSLYLQYAFYFIPVYLIILSYPFKVIIDGIKQENRNRHFIILYLLIFISTFFEALNQLGVTKDDYIRPLFFLRFFGADKWRIENQIFIYILVSLISVYIIMAVIKRISADHLSSNIAFDVENIFKEYKVSPREKEIILMAVKGYSYDEIAEKSFIAKNTVKNHLKNIYQKLGVKNKTELAGKLYGRKERSI